MIKYLIEKEFKQLFRNPFIPKLILLFPCMIMILMPWAASLEIRNIRLDIVDGDHSSLSRRLVEKVAASDYFRVSAFPATYDEALRHVEAGWPILCWRFRATSRRTGCVAMRPVCWWLPMR